MSFTTFILISLNLIILFGFVVLAFMIGLEVGYNKAKKEAEETLKKTQEGSDE